MIDNAETAWLLAEDQLGDHQTTAILAYNYANLIYSIVPAKAIKPLERVLELLDNNDAMFGAEPPDLLLAITRAYIEREDAKAHRKLRKLLNNREQAGFVPSLAAARGWAIIA